MTIGILFLLYLVLVVAVYYSFPFESRDLGIVVSLGLLALAYFIFPFG